MHYVDEHRALVVPEHPHIASCLPQAPIIDLSGHRHHVLKHDEPTTLFLRQMGVPISAPILRHYDWRGTSPFAAQKLTAVEACLYPRLFVLNDLGTGKTRAVLFAFDWLRQIGKVNKALVVAPLSILETVWQLEILRYFPFKTAILHGTADRRRKLLADDSCDVYIVNPDGLPILEKELCSRTDIDLVILDETTTYRNTRTDLWKSVRNVIADKPRVWGLTGNPNPTGPMDAYGQVKLIRPENLKGQRFGAFREQHMLKTSQFTWKPRKGSTEAVAKLFYPSVRFTRAECTDLPPTSQVTYKAALSPIQEKIYKVIQSNLAVAIDHNPVIAANAGVLLSKLVQVGTGVVYDGTKTPREIGAPAREKLLQEILDSMAPGTKAIVFVPFTALGVYLQAKIVKNAPFICGAVSRKERVRIFSEFQNNPEPRVLLAHPGCMAHGLTLTAANVIVWYGPLPNPEIYTQANARIVRPSQTRNTYIVHIESSYADKAIFRDLKSDQKWSNTLLDVIKKGV